MEDEEGVLLEVTALCIRMFGRNLFRSHVRQNHRCEHA